MDLHVLNKTFYKSLPGSRESLKWSGDSHLAFCLKDAVYILTPRRDVSSNCYEQREPLQFFKIFPHKKPLNLFIRRSRDATYKEAHDERHICMVYDRTLSPETENLLSCQSFCSIGWSPRVTRTNSCVLACLTLDHRLNVWWQTSTNHWKQVIDLSERLCEFVERTNFTHMPEPPGSSKSERVDYEIQCVYSIATQALCWLPAVFKGPGGSYSVLVTTTKSGYISLWQVAVPVIDASSFSDPVLFATDNKDPSCLSTSSTSQSTGFIFVGNNCGTVSAIPVNCHTELGDSALYVGEGIVLWSHQDSIAVKQVLHDTKNDIVYIVKGFHLIVLHVTVTADELTVHATHHESISTDYHLTGVCLFKEGILITMLDAKEYYVTVTREGNTFLCDKQPVNLPVDKKPYHILALDTSPNQYLVAQLMHSVAGSNYINDKYAVELIIFSTLDDSTLSQNILSKTDAVEAFSSIDDLMQIMKYVIYKNGSIPLDLLRLLQNVDPLDYSTAKLQFLRFLAHIQRTLLLMHDFDTISSDLVSTIDMSLLLRNIKRNMRLMSAQLKALSDNAEEAKLKSVLEVGCYQFCQLSHNEDDINDIKELQTEHGVQAIAQQICVICNEKTDIVVQQEQMRYCCSKNHKFAVCCHTLAPCFVLRVNACWSCGTVAIHPDTVGDSFRAELLISPCPICDHVLHCS